MYAIDCRVDSALGRSLMTPPETTICPPCLYRTKQEPMLTHSILVAMDGNNSLKLVDNMFHSGKPWKDEHDALSSRWIDPEHIDRFKDDAGKCSTDTSNGSLLSTFGNDTDPDWLHVVQDNGSTSVMPEKLPVCIERWKNAGPESRKRMFAMFSVSGVFLAVCHHGHVLAICDMIRSGEL